MIKRPGSRSCPNPWRIEQRPEARLGNHCRTAHGSLWNTFPSMIRFVVIMVLVKAGSEVRDSFRCVKYDSPLIKKNHWSVVGAVFLVYLTLALGIIYKEMLTFNSSTILNSSHNIRTSYINRVPLNFPLVSRIPSPQCRCVFRSSRADRKSWSRDCRRIWSTAEPRQREYVNNGELCGDILCWMMIDWLIDWLMDGWMDGAFWCQDC